MPPDACPSMASISCFYTKRCWLNRDRASDRRPPCQTCELGRSPGQQPHCYRPHQAIQMCPQPFEPWLPHASSLTSAVKTTACHPLFESCRRFPALSLIEINHQDARALRCQLDRNGSPYSNPSTGHQCRFSFQLSHSSFHPNHRNGQFRLSIAERSIPLVRFVLSCARCRPQTQMDYSILISTITRYEYRLPITSVSRAKKR